MARYLGHCVAEGRTIWEVLLLSDWKDQKFFTRWFSVFFFQ